MYRYNKQKRQLAKRYSREKLMIGVFNGLIVPIIFLIVLLAGGFNSQLVVFARAFGALSLPLYAAAFLTLLNLVQFPVRFYSSFIYEHKYNLSNYTLGGWLVDYAKGRFLGYLFFVPVVTGFLLIAGAANWWLLATAAYALLVLFMSYIYPIVIMPFFYRMEPYRDAAHKRRLFAAIRQLGLRDIKDIVVVRESEKSKKPNAVFIGIGRTRTIGLYDTLLNDFPRAEVESVIWHELGHYVNKDNIKHVVAETLKIGIMLYIIDYAFVSSAVGFSTATFPLVMLYFTVLDLMSEPVLNTYSRLLERKADIFAIETGRDIAAHVSAEMRLADMHLSELKPHPLVEFMFFTHPSVQRRIDYSREYYKNVVKKRTN